MWNRLKKPLAALSVGLNVAFVAVWLVHAVPGPAGGPQPFQSVDGEGQDFFHRNIGVSDEQWQQVEPHLREFSKKAQARRQTIITLRGELMDLLDDPSVTERAIRDKQKEILANKRDMLGLVIELLLKEKEILTAEQQRDLISAIRRHCRFNEAEAPGNGRLGPMLRNDEPASSKGSSKK